jgi:hypothetical protein
MFFRGVERWMIVAAIVIASVLADDELVGAMA